MAKVSIKSEIITPFGGIFQVREQFSRYVGPLIDEVLESRCASFDYLSCDNVGSLSRICLCSVGCARGGANQSDF